MNRELVQGAGSLEQATEWVGSAQRVLIAAGAGLSAAAGFDYGDRERFAELFPALHSVGFEARYQMIGFPLPPRHQWGFWAVHVTDVRYTPGPNALYSRLRALVGDRSSFVMTSNVDRLFARNGFDPAASYTPQGDYGLYQCLTPCTREVWDARPVIDRALEHYDPSTGATDESAVPVCPNCGGATSLNVYAGDWYINDHFEAGRVAANDWVADAAASHDPVTVIEIGAGFNTPAVIRWPIERIVSALPHARFVRINPDHSGVPPEIADRSVSIDLDAHAALDILGAPAA